jgi:hypothetical protein
VQRPEDSQVQLVPATSLPAFLDRLGHRVTRLPPLTYFLTSAVFHYLGPSLAVLLFVHVGVLGVAWLRIVSAAVVLALWRRPWRLLARLDGSQRRLLVCMGAVLAIMNGLFYLAAVRRPGAPDGEPEGRQGPAARRTGPARSRHGRGSGRGAAVRRR